MWKEKFKPVVLKNINSKILVKVLAKQIQKYIKRIIYHDKMRFILGQEWFNICKPINVIYHIIK